MTDSIDRLQWDAAQPLIRQQLAALAWPNETAVETFGRLIHEVHHSEHVAFADCQQPACVEARTPAPRPVVPAADPRCPHCGLHCGHAREVYAPLPVVPAAEEELTHYGSVGTAECGANVPNMGLTTIAAHVTCQTCRGLLPRGEHDNQCESELTSHGYTPCRCSERSRPVVPAAEESGQMEYPTHDRAHGWLTDADSTDVILRNLTSWATAVNVASGDLERAVTRDGIDRRSLGYGEPTWLRGVGDRIDRAVDVLRARHATRPVVPAAEEERIEELDDACDNDIGPMCRVLYPASRASWCEGCLNTLVEPAVALPVVPAYEEALIAQRLIGHGEGQRDAIADVNAGRVDDLIQLRLDQATKPLHYKIEQLEAQIAALPVVSERGEALTLTDLAKHLGWGDLTPDNAFAFACEREHLLRVAQTALETHRSNAPTAGEALLERIAALRTLVVRDAEQETDDAANSVDRRGGRSDLSRLHPRPAVAGVADLPHAQVAVVRDAGEALHQLHDALQQFRDHPVESGHPTASGPVLRLIAAAEKVEATTIQLVFGGLRRNHHPVQVGMSMAK